MTLRELMNSVDRAPSVEIVPSVVRMMKEGSPVAASKKMGQGLEITVFKNGYVIYQDDEYMTVFPLHICRDYVEKDVMDGEHLIPFEVFADQPWQVRVFMEGDQRIVHNRNSRRFYAREISYEGMIDDLGEDTVEDKWGRDPLSRMVEDFIRNEETEILQRNLDRLTEKQLFILMQCVVKGRLHSDVARELGTTRMNVSNILRKSIRKLRTYYGIQDREIARNRFSNKKYARPEDAPM